MAADDKSLSNFSRHQVHVDIDGSGLYINIANDESISVGIGQRCCPEEFAGFTIVYKESTWFPEETTTTLRSSGRYQSAWG